MKLSYPVLTVGLALGTLPTTLSAQRGRAEGGTPLPQQVQTSLMAHGCRVPSSPPLNPDRGAIISFVAYRAVVMDSGRRDWIILCERPNVREALVLRDSAGIYHVNAALRLSGWSPKDEGCEGWIAVTDSASIRLLLKEHVGRNLDLRPEERRRRLHAGIRDGICEGSGQAVWYWTGYRWVRIRD